MVWCSKTTGPDIALGLLATEGAPELSGIDEGNGTKVDKLELCVEVGMAEIGALFGIGFDIVTDAGDTDCSGAVKDRVEEGKEVELKLTEAGLLRTKGEGYSGNLEPGKLDAPAGKDELKPEYGICCMDGGIDSPGGG